MVSFPGRSSPASVQNFVEGKTEWISKALQRSKQIEERSLAFFPTIKSLEEKTVRDGLSTRIEQLATVHGFEYNTLSFRNQRSRWGSCSARNNISLNKNLFHLPDDLRDYVLLHELAHTREKNHSRQFWRILYDILGQAETVKRRQKLREFEYLFYPPHA